MSEISLVEEVPAQELIEKVAEELKKVEHVKPPEWAKFVKTGAHKERPPLREDWWYIRSAAVLRSIYKLGPIGVSKLRTKYGGLKNRGFASEHFRKGSGSIIRNILQQLEKSGLIKQGAKGVHKGRMLTKEGFELLKKCAKEVKSKIKE